MATNPNSKPAPIALRGAAAIGQPGSFEEHFGAPFSLPIGKAFQRYAGVGRSSQYVLAGRGDIESFLVGSRRYILVQSWVDYVARQRGKEAARLAAGTRPRMRGEAR